MHLASIHVGRPRAVSWQGKTLQTAIFKERAGGPVRAAFGRLEGDESAHKEVHGGEYSAAYSYASEHYAFWRAELARAELAPAAFGENLSTVGLDEAEVCVGDRYRFGEVLLQATQPRIPCAKLEMATGTPGMIERFSASGRWGIYWRVLEEGVLREGDRIECVSVDPARLPMSLFYDYESAPRALLEATLEHEALHPMWRKRIRQRLNKQDEGPSN
ncbi:MAG: MOSC domain-containing protein [Deltaproteobacteria bacterium]|nr:MOSC domain-containing protein [Deltaproteobacteria bacterium]